MSRLLMKGIVTIHFAIIAVDNVHHHLNYFRAARKEDGDEIPMGPLRVPTNLGPMSRGYSE